MDPSIESKIRILSIATFRRSPQDGSCNQNNWNYVRGGEGRGRADVDVDADASVDVDANAATTLQGCRIDVWNNFKNAWWIENDWAYNGQFKSKSTNTKKTAACSMGRVFDCLPYSLTFPPLQPPRAST